MALAPVWQHRGRWRVARRSPDLDRRSDPICRGPCRLCRVPGAGCRVPGAGCRVARITGRVPGAADFVQQRARIAQPGPSFFWQNWRFSANSRFFAENSLQISRPGSAVFWRFLAKNTKKCKKVISHWPGFGPLLSDFRRTKGRLSSIWCPVAVS